MRPHAPGLRACFLVLLAAGVSPAPAHADEDEEEGHEDVHARFEVSLSGYGEIGFAFHDHGADRNREGGALRDRRLEFDTTRLVTILESELPGGFEVEAEVEFEHGGTGAAQEIEYDEFGEFEKEVDKGGEVLVEELYLARKLGGGRFELKVGRFYVAVGQLSYYYRPTDYLGSVRSEAETTVLPAQWDEIGASFVARLPRLRLTAQVVNGLDSTGFSSQFWVASGHQGAFETGRATDLAAVARVDLRPIPELEVGASGYIGGSSRNRPKPDLIEDCAEPRSDEVAACDYINGTVAIADLHARWVGHRFRAQAWGMWGHLTHANAISQRNARLSNQLDVARTAVGDGAVALAAEVGYDVARVLGLEAADRIEPFARLDYMDTMFDLRAGLFDNPRFERTIIGLGVSWTHAGAIVGKLDVSQRRFGSSDLRSENTVRATAGFVF